jgi:hypothetical protein
MKVNNTITITGARDQLSSSGNVERFTFEITSQHALPPFAVEELANMHGFGGQSFAAEHAQHDGTHFWNGQSTRYSD